MDEFKERAKMYSKLHTELVIHKPEGMRIDVYEELQKLRPRYNRKHHNTHTLANHENREKEVLEREKILCEMIKQHYLNGVPYSF